MDLAELRDRLTSRDWQQTEPDPEDPVRLALVGLGWWTVDSTLPAIADAEGVAATVLVSSSAEKAERVARENAHLVGVGTARDGTETDRGASGTDHGATGIDYDAFHDGAAAEEYDAVYVGTPNATHLEYAETAADLGKAVLVEKPLEASVERAEALVEATADVPAMTAYRLHAEPSLRAARELVREGAIGEPVAVQAHIGGNILDIGDADQWRLDPAMAGPGATVTDVGVYPINTARFLLDRRPVAAHASLYSEHEAFADVPDERASFLLEFEDGVTASVSASLRAQGSSAIRVIGTEGEVGLDPGLDAEPRRELHYASGDVRHAVEFPVVDQMREEMAFFADHLRDGRAFGPDVEQGLDDVRAIQAVYDAGERGERVAIERGD